MYEGKYLLGTAIARPLLARRQVESCPRRRRRRTGSRLHRKGKRSGTVRIDIQSFRSAISRSLPRGGNGTFAPGRMRLVTRKDRNIPITATAEKIYSRDSNIWHMSHEGGILEDPPQAPPEDLFMLTLDPRSCPEGESEITIDFEQGVPVGLNGYRIPAGSIAGGS